MDIGGNPSVSVTKITSRSSMEAVRNFMKNFEVKSRFEDKLEWRQENIQSVTLYVPNFFEGQDDSQNIPTPDDAFKVYWDSLAWSIIYTKYASNSNYSFDEIKYLCALWGYTGHMGVPLASGWTSDPKWEYVSPPNAPPTANTVTVGGIKISAEDIAIYGYVSWALSVRFAERNSNTPLKDHKVFQTVQRFFPCLQNTTLLVELVTYLSNILRGYFRSGAKVCASMSIYMYGPSIVKGHDETNQKRYQCSNNSDIPNWQGGWYGLISIGVFMSGFSAYETVIEGLRKHRKTMRDIIPYFMFDPFPAYFTEAQIINKALSDDPWYGLCQKIFENADTPMSANKFPIPTYVGICFQTIENKHQVPDNMPGINILEDARKKYAAYVYYVIAHWTVTPDLSQRRPIWEYKDGEIIEGKEFFVTEKDLEDYGKHSQSVPIGNPLFSMKGESASVVDGPNRSEEGDSDEVESGSEEGSDGDLPEI